MRILGKPREFAPAGLTARRYAARTGRFAATAICRYAANRGRERKREKRGERGEEELYPVSAAAVLPPPLRARIYL